MKFKNNKKCNMFLKGNKASLKNSKISNKNK